MSKFDTFFSTNETMGLNDKVLKSALPELELNRIFQRRKRFLAFFAPLTAVLATFFVFKVVNRNETESIIANSDQIELIADLIEDEDAIDIIANLSLLEDLDLIETLEIEDA